jgi:hypothetical protein
MNPLKNLLNKVFDQTPPVDPAAPPAEETAFEWNPDAESVAPTSARTTSWKRNDAPDEASTDAVASNSRIPSPMLQRAPEAAATAPSLQHRTEAPVAPLAPPTLAQRAAVAAVAPTSADISAPLMPTSTGAATAQSLVPASDFEDVYRKAGIKSPVHGYGVERVYRLLTSRRLVGLDRSVRRSALLTALDAAGVPPSDVSQDAVLRRKALTAYEAEKALELQSLRSRNESRVEALQDTVETFTRQKQSQIERLAQGSTSAVRAQSDLEIRKRMEQDRLYRSLAYFVEPLPAAAAAAEKPRAAMPPSAKVIEASTAATTESADEKGASTRPLSHSGLEAALRAAAEDRAASEEPVTLVTPPADVKKSESQS